MSQFQRFVHSNIYDTNNDSSASPLHRQLSQLKPKYQMQTPKVCLNHSLTELLHEPKLKGQPTAKPRAQERRLSQLHLKTSKETLYNNYKEMALNQAGTANSILQKINHHDFAKNKFKLARIKNHRIITDQVAKQSSMRSPVNRDHVQ